MPNKNSDAIDAILKWRGALQFDSGANRAATARLRRATGVLDALMLVETLDLIKAVRRAEPEASSQLSERRLVVLALTLVHVKGKGESKTPFARALGQTAKGRAPTGDERPRLSPARFGALVRSARARDWEGCARALRRALVILGDTPIDVASYVRDLLFLDDAALRRWIYQYWQPHARAEDEPTQSASSPQETAP